VRERRCDVSPASGAQRIRVLPQPVAHVGFDLRGHPEVLEPLRLVDEQSHPVAQGRAAPDVLAPLVPEPLHVRTDPEPVDHPPQGLLRDRQRSGRAGEPSARGAHRVQDLLPLASLEGPREPVRVEQPRQLFSACGRSVGTAPSSDLLDQASAAPAVRAQPTLQDRAPFRLEQLVDERWWRFPRDLVVVAVARAANHHRRDPPRALPPRPLRLRWRGGGRRGGAGLLSLARGFGAVGPVALALRRDLGRDSSRDLHERLRPERARRRRVRQHRSHREQRVP
jgi:hypothetical protein